MVSSLNPKISPFQDCMCFWIPAKYIQSHFWRIFLISFSYHWSDKLAILLQSMSYSQFEETEVWKWFSSVGQYFWMLSFTTWPISYIRQKALPFLQLLCLATWFFFWGGGLSILHNFFCGIDLIIICQFEYDHFLCRASQPQVYCLFFKLQIIWRISTKFTGICIWPLYW